MKRIACLIDSLGPGGAQRQFVGLASMLADRNYDVMVVTYHDNPFFRPVLEEKHIIIKQVDAGVNAIKRILGIRRLVKVYRADCVIAYQETPSIIACIVRLMGIKYKLIVSERSTTQVKTLKDSIRFALYSKANFIVPNSYSQDKYIRDNYPRLAARTVPITNFVDLRLFTYTEHKKRKIPEIIVAASIWPRKNTDGFIRALNDVKQKGLLFHVSWYGKAESHIDYFRECEVLIHSFHLDDYISLLPKTSNITEKYRECDFFCLPSFYEGTPNVICEAIASGRPVICSNVCDNGIYVKKDVNGELFDPTDINSIAESIIRILSIDDELYELYCKNSRILAEQLLSETAFISKYIELL